MSDVNVVPHRGGIAPEKLNRQHRDRLAIVYIRQSTVQRSTSRTSSRIDAPTIGVG